MATHRGLSRAVRRSPEEPPLAKCKRTKQESRTRKGGQQPQESWGPSPRYEMLLKIERNCKNDSKIEYKGHKRAKVSKKLSIAIIFLLLSTATLLCRDHKAL